MPSAGPVMQYRRYRVPRSHGETFFDPPLSEAPRLIPANVALRRAYSTLWCGEPWVTTAAAARHELIELATRYTRAYRDVAALANASLADPLILMTGHQPQLFHPGVWYKNFMLAKLAKAHGAVAIHLIIDNDATGLAAIRAPAGSIANPRLETVAYDRSLAQVPLEEHPIQDRELFNSFGSRVQRILQSFVSEPLVRTWWPTVIKSSQVENNLGRCLARARHLLEGEWGIETLEIPLSVLCETATFRRFVGRLLADLPRFRDIYNRSLQEYRHVNRVRSHSHPAPELQQFGEWLEAPFWIWNTNDPKRRRLFVRRLGERLELSDRDKLQFTISSPASERCQPAIAELVGMAAAGVKLRPRALLTTMYARLILSDLFLHGIGGGKYDQLTDVIIQQFFGVSPPQFFVVTATAQLPVPRPMVADDELRRLNQQLRDLEHNPDRHLATTDETRTFIASKLHWLANDAPRGARGERHLGIQQANAALRPFVAEAREQLLLRRERLVTMLRHDKILGSREFAFCLFPESTLRALLLDK